MMSSSTATRADAIRALAANTPVVRLVVLLIAILTGTVVLDVRSG
jgi:hypothetical protein